MEDKEPPSSAKQNTTCPSPSADCHAPSRQEKSKHPSEHSRRLDDDDGDDHPPSATSHMESNKDMATGTASHLADKMLADVEHVKQLVLLGDATSTNGCVTASPHSRSSSLEWPGSDVDFTQIEEHEDPYEVEPETKAFNEDISDDESDAYKPDDDNKDANKVGEEEEEEEVLLSPNVIQTKGKVWTAPSKKEHYKVLRDSEEGEEKWDIMRQYYIETAAGVESRPKSSVGHVMAARDAFVKSVAAFCHLQNLHIFGFVIHTGVEEDSRQASGMWGSPLVRKIIDENHMDLKRMINWWTTVIKFTHIQDSEEGPSMPAIGSGRAVNPIEYLCRAGEPVRDRNRRMLKAMVLELLIPHGYVKRSVLWKRLCHEVENLHFTILNWPEEIPIPDTQFDFHKLDANEDNGENSKGKGKGKGKKGKGKVVEEPYVPQDGDDLAFMAWPRDVINIYRRGGPLAEAIPLVKSRTCPDKASKILLTVGGLHGKKPLASIVDEHDEDVIDEEWPGLAVKDTGFRNTDNSDSTRNAAHRANRLPPSTSDHNGHSIEWPRSPSRHRVLDRPHSPQRRRSLDRPRSPHRHRSPPPECHHSPHRPPDRLAPASRQKRGRIDVNVDSNQFEEVVNTHERVPVVKRA
ncbi:hypothetical protein PAXINDRAFT_8011 [Paxillus involutus ATCC 200175]|nr:hypothetical protein PAXINDRAFT_8011 [Paxillus involutus ATCC 200175]